MNMPRKSEQIKSEGITHPKNIHLTPQGSFALHTPH